MESNNEKKNDDNNIVYDCDTFIELAQLNALKKRELDLFNRREYLGSCDVDDAVDYFVVSMLFSVFRMGIRMKRYRFEIGFDETEFLDTDDLYTEFRKRGFNIQMVLEDRVFVVSV